MLATVSQEVYASDDSQIGVDYAMTYDDLKEIFPQADFSCEQNDLEESIEEILYSNPDKTYKNVEVYWTNDASNQF